MITFSDAVNIREILLCSTLSERPVKIEFATQAGPHLQRLLKLLQVVQTGCKIEVNPRGLIYIPGIVTNRDGQLIRFDCGIDRSISYFLEMLLIVALFGKSELNIELDGLTNDGVDTSIDTVINAYIPLMKNFIPELDCSVKVLRRGFGIQGSVSLHLAPVKYISSVTLGERGPIKRIRGVCSGSKVAPNLLNRVVSECRSVFNDYIPDVWIHTDLQKNQKGIEMESGYAVSLIAESIDGKMISSDCEYSSEFNDPEAVGHEAALRLLDEIKHSGVVDTSLQQYALLLMAFSEKKLSSINIGRLSTHTVETLRIIKSLLGVTFHIDAQTFSCFGCGLNNISRQMQ